MSVLICNENVSIILFAYLEENKVAIWIKKDDNVEELLNNLFANPDKMQEMKIRARLISKKNSTKDICKILFNNAMSFKKLLTFWEK